MCVCSAQCNTVCAAVCTHGEVRLAVGENVDFFYAGDTDYSDAYYDKNGLTRGRVEVCVSERYGSVCQNPWTEMDASVVCKQLGFSEYGILYLHLSTMFDNNIIRFCWCECRRFF